MADLISTVSTALTIASRLKEISDKIRDAEFRNLVADLSIELAEVKLKAAGLLEENAKLHGNKGNKGVSTLLHRMTSYVGFVFFF
jgi:hypothetical protein